MYCMFDMKDQILGKKKYFLRIYQKLLSVIDETYTYLTQRLFSIDFFMRGKITLQFSSKSY